VIKKAIANSFWSGLEVAANPLLLLIATPIFLSKLGPEQYGLWMLLNTISAIFGILTNSLKSLHIKSCSENIELSRSGVLLSSIITLMLGVTILNLVGLLSAKTVIETISASSAQLLSTISLLIIAFAFTSLRAIEELLRGQLQASGLFQSSAIMSTVSFSILVTSQLIVVFVTPSLENVLLIAFVVQLCLIPLELWFVQRVAFIEKLQPRIDFKLLRDSKLYTAWAGADSTLGYLSSQADRYLVSFLLGLETLAYYSVALMVFNSSHRLGAGAVRWLFPVANKAISAKQDFRMLYFGAQALVVGCVCVYASVLLLVDDVFVLWLGPELYLKTESLICAFLVLLMIDSTTLVPFSFFRGQFLSVLVKFKAVSTMLNLIAMIGLASSLGAVGVIAGKALGPLVANCVGRYVIQKRVFGKFELQSSVTFVVPPILLALVFLAGDHVPLISFLLLFAFVAYVLVYVRPLVRLRAAKISNGWKI